MGRKKSDQLHANVLVRNKVLHFVFSHIHDGKPVKLPSVSEYARELGLSTRTIITEMGRLVDEGQITSKKRVGYFTNLYDKLEYESLQYLTGIFFNCDMSYAVYDFNQWSLQMQPGAAITYHKTSKVQPIFSSSHNPECFYKELGTLSLNAAVFIHCPEIWFEPIRRFMKSGHPVILVNPVIQLNAADFSDLPSVMVDRFACGQELGRLAMKRIPNCKAPIFWCNYHDQRNSIISEGFFKTFKGKNPVRIFESSGEMISELKKGLRENEYPAMIFTHTTWTADIIEIFIQAGVDPYKNTLFIGDFCQTWSIPGYQGLSFGYPHKELGEAVNTLLVQQKAHKKVKSICLKMIVKEDFLQNNKPCS